MARYVIIRDDDVNATTPADCLERVYRPLLNKSIPINLAVIPCVNTHVRHPEGGLEGYLMSPTPSSDPRGLPIGTNRELVDYLLKEPGYQIIQNGFSHDWMEFDSHDRLDLRRRLVEGKRYLMEAGFPEPLTFVAPYDKLSLEGYEETAKQFRIISSRKFDWRRLPREWKMPYVMKKLQRKPHWKADNTLLLSHPGYFLNRQKPYDQIFKTIKEAIDRQWLTVIVSRWWDYYNGTHPDLNLIHVMHEVGDYLAQNQNIKVISFRDLLNKKMSL